MALFCLTVALAAAAGSYLQTFRAPYGSPYQDYEGSSSYVDPIKKVADTVAAKGYLHVGW
jgi:hypothetical protein